MVFGFIVKTRLDDFGWTMPDENHISYKIQLKDLTTRTNKRWLRISAGLERAGHGVVRGEAGVLF